MSSDGPASPPSRQGIVDGGSSSPAERQRLLVGSDAGAGAADHGGEAGTGLQLLQPPKPPDDLLPPDEHPQHPQHPQRARRWTQILSVLAVSFGCFIHGTTVAFPAVFIPGLVASNMSSSNDSSSKLDSVNATEEELFYWIPMIRERLPFYIYSADLPLLVSIPSFGMLVGSLVAGPMANLVGRKWTCVLGTCGNLALSYALIPAVQFLWMLELSRFLMGTGLGFSITISTLYIMEVTTPEMRAGLAVVPAIAGSLGLLTIQVLGAVMHWRRYCLLLAALNVPFLVMLLFIPETPVYLIRTEQIERAHKVLRMVRGRDWDVTRELTDLKCAYDGNKEQEKDAKVKLRDFVAPSVLKPFVITLCLMFFFQFTGINIVLQYTVDIFKSAGMDNAYMSSIWVGVALMVSNVVTLLTAPKMPRRAMLLLSAAGIAVTLVVLGVFFHLRELEAQTCLESPLMAPVTPSPPPPRAEKLLEREGQPVVLNSLPASFAKDGQSGSDIISAVTRESSSGDNPEEDPCPAQYTAGLGWLPLLLMMLYIFFFNLGYGAMIFITVAEILPLKVRPVTNSLSVAFTCVCSFLTSHTYLGLKDEIGAAGLFWLYGAVSAVGLLFILATVPETKGKTEAEIAEFFLSKAEKRSRRRGRDDEA